MPSFSFADCPTKLDLTVGTGTPDQSGTVGCTIRNTTARRQTARIRIEPLGDAKPDWFAFAGAPPTSPLELEQDIEAGGTLSVQATVRIPPKTPPGRQTFRLRVTSEATPDTDFADGPAIAFDIAAIKEPEPAKKPAFPWWAVAVAAVLLLVVAGAVGFLAWPRGLDPALVIGKPFTDAVPIAAAHGFPDIKAAPGQAKGNDPATRIVVDVGKDASGATVLLVDPGVKIPDLARQPVVEATKTLISLGILPNQNPAFDARGDMDDGVVTRTVPVAGTAVTLGGTVTLVLNNKPAPGGTNPPRNPCVRISDCVHIPADRWNRGLFPDRLREMIR